ncbi:MAG: RluA family pseudouridine synthase [Alphaproteobacteria bacterium]|jgi:23S rRNA pseudouridine1911/1915/1917 synthase|nr:RluA family pseudouridine synthase [Alphaproteobacteria bacterium]
MCEDPKTEVHEIVVEPDQARQRLDRLLSQAVEGLSRMRIKALIEAGQVTIAQPPEQTGDRRTVTEASYRVKPGETVILEVPPPEDATPRAQAMDLDIVYEDEHLIVIDKPAGLVVHPAPGNPDHTLVNALLAHCGDSLSGVGGVRRPGIVHRLDKDTSGLLVAAKHDAAHVGLSELFARHDIQRRYRALVWGHLAQASGSIEGNIGRDPNNRKKMAIVPRGGKHAVTHYAMVESFGLTASLIDCRLETGRTHQIRVHMSSHGHPVLGDPLYSRAKRGRNAGLSDELRQKIADFKRQALHAAELGFRHPVDGRDLKFASEPPHDMLALLELFRRLGGA